MKKPNPLLEKLEDVLIHAAESIYPKMSWLEAKDLTRYSHAKLSTIQNTLKEITKNPDEYETRTVNNKTEYRFRIEREQEDSLKLTLDEIFAYLLKNKKTKVEDLIQSFSCKTLYLHGLIAFLASQTVNNQRLILCEKEDKTNSVVIYLNEKLYSILDGITLTLAAEDNSVFYKLFEKRYPGENFKKDFGFPIVWRKNGNYEETVKYSEIISQNVNSKKHNNQDKQTIPSKIYDFLRNSTQWVSTLEISKAIGTTSNNVAARLSEMLKNTEYQNIQRKKEFGSNGKETYFYFIHEKESNFKNDTPNGAVQFLHAIWTFDDQNSLDEHFLLLDQTKEDSSTVKTFVYETENDISCDHVVELEYENPIREENQIIQDKTEKEDTLSSDSTKIVNSEDVQLIDPNGERQAVSQQTQPENPGLAAPTGSTVVKDVAVKETIVENFEYNTASQDTPLTSVTCQTPIGEKTNGFSPNMENMLATLLQQTEILAKQITGLIAPVIQQQITNGLRQQVEIALQNAIKELPVIQAEVAQKIKKISKTEHREKVLIVGLHTAQVDEIKKEFSNCFKLSFLGSDDNTSQSRDAAKNSDHVIAMVSHMGHSKEGVLKAANDNYIRISGGMSKLKDKLTELFCQSSPSLEGQQQYES